MDRRDQIKFVLDSKLREIDLAAQELTSLCRNAWPTVPFPRSQVRYVTSKLGVQYKPKKPMNAVAFYVRTVKKEDTRFSYWCPTVANGHSILADCRSPRDAARVLARLDAFHAWLIARKAGVAKAQAHLLQQQEPWTEKLNARIAILELSSGNIQEDRNLPKIPDWPSEAKNLLKSSGNGKISLVKWIREYLHCGLSEAVRHADAAITAFRDHGYAVFINPSWSPTFTL
jgi:ribosomal protein L7/L12